MPKIKLKSKATLWLDEALELVIKGLNQGFTMIEVSRKYGILRFSLRDYYEGITRGEKDGI